MIIKTHGLAGGVVMEIDGKSYSKDKLAQYIKVLHAQLQDMKESNDKLKRGAKAHYQREINEIQ